MFTSRRIQALVREHQARDGFSANNVGLDDFVDVSLGDVPVPDRVGIDYEIRAVLTLVETARLVGPHFTFEAAFGQLLFEQFLQFCLAFRVTASPWVTRRALVAAYKNVLFELGHKIPQFLEVDRRLNLCPVKKRRRSYAFAFTTLTSLLEKLILPADRRLLSDIAIARAGTIRYSVHIFPAFIP
jgi:hypothetical protein